MKLLAWSVISSAIIFSSCNLMGNRIKGNGSIKSETRTAGLFDRIDVSGNIDVFVKQDSVSSVRVETDENLLEYIQITTEGGTLRIKPRDNSNLKGTKGINVYVTNPSYASFDVSGACDLVSENKINSQAAIDLDVSGASEITMQVNAPKLSAEVSGASKIDVSGETKDLSIDCQGASKAKCFNLMTENADVNISGASHAEVFASVKLEADASGASHIKYKGNAAVNQKSSGAGSVKKAD